MLTLTPTRPSVTTEAGSVRGAELGSRKAGFYRHDLDGLRAIGDRLAAGRPAGVA